jgi:mono/diheme cytochrome c family protein
MKNFVAKNLGIRAGILALGFLFALGSYLFAGEPPGKKDPTNTAVERVHDSEGMRIEGEKRFRANCGRCHAAPQKFPPRMMATVLRHMRVRATITDQDMRLVLFYMTQ